MKQTWLGKIACRLGFHLVVKTWENKRDEYPTASSCGGGCLRCREIWQWDN